MKCDIIRIYARFRAMPEMVISELKANWEHVPRRIDELREQFGTNWQVWGVPVVKHHPAKKRSRWEHCRIRHRSIQPIAVMMP